ncbi:response regulator [Halovivax sp.]|uniref:response regulator n=1 Tax=Halovivax sp. TaxID=1935978 RepID=UPI0025B8E57C|nr:response regulator [Halovivax sp.]
MDIVLVEDNPGDVRLIEEAFADAATAETAFRVFTDGTSAVEFFDDLADSPEATFPDLLLLDLNLPRMDGFEVLEELRADPDLATLPVLVLTSSAAEEDVRDCYRRSANAYLTKPDSPDEFDRLVNAVERFWFKTARLPPTPASS